jgi:hypothetical protein
MGALGGLGRIMCISIISYGKNSLDLRPTLVMTSPREWIEFVCQIFFLNWGWKMCGLLVHNTFYVILKSF